VTDCAEALCPSEKEAQTSSPQHKANLAAPKCQPEREPGTAELFSESEGHGNGEEPGKAAVKNSPA